MASRAGRLPVSTRYGDDEMPTTDKSRAAEQDGICVLPGACPCARPCARFETIAAIQSGAISGLAGIPALRVLPQPA
jgi:hypothetical protein